MIIYKFTNLINNKLYIGLTTKDWTSRFLTHKRKHKNKDALRVSALYGAMVKYGFENFKFEIIDSANTKEQLQEKERYWIKELNTLTPNGYNITSGGETQYLRQESRDKISASLKSKNFKLTDTQKSAFDAYRKHS